MENELIDYSDMLDQIIHNQNNILDLFNSNNILVNTLIVIVLSLFLYLFIMNFFNRK